MRLIDALDMVLAEHARSVEKYGTWSDYSLDQMMAVIINELMVEAGGAEELGDLHGEHGVIRELAQVSACCIKAMMVLSNRPKFDDLFPPGAIVYLSPGIRPADLRAALANLCPKETLAETLRAAGAHSSLKGCALPASPSFLQSKQGSANHPMEGSR